MQNDLQFNSNGEFEFPEIGEEVRKQGKYQSSKELVYQPDGTFALLKRGQRPRQGEIVTEFSQGGFAF